MEMTAEATYENGVLKLDQPMTLLKEGERVRVTVETPLSRVDATYGMIGCKNPDALRHFAESSVYELEEEEEGE